MGAMRSARAIDATVVLMLCASACVSARDRPRGPVPDLQLRAPPRPRDLGYGGRFRVDAVFSGEAPADARVTWRQLSGAPLRDVRVDRGGLLFEANMPAANDVGLSPPSTGVVPVSPRTSAEVVLEAAWRPDGGETVRRRVRLSAASRSRGLSTVASGAGVLLAGSGWEVASAPPGGSRALLDGGGFTRFFPDATGRWVLRDATGRATSFRAARYDETPLDCGRSGCHEAIASAAQRSPMTFALRTLLDRGLANAAECAAACHATGELDVNDGGFDCVARELGVRLDADWAALPRDLRRVGGVTCLACHGPAAIPEPQSRWSILRADVCETCHDAPPEYGHVAAWMSSRMARADADPKARSTAPCARCHTTAGFVSSVTSSVPRTPPADAGPMGIGCAACHAVHDARGSAPSDALLREVDLPAAFDRVPLASRVCVPCHAPDGRIPAASAAAVWAGRGGVEPMTGAPLEAALVHGEVPGGCVGCHRLGPPDLARGAAHAFRADLGGCVSCHGGRMPDTDAAARDLREEARALSARLASSLNLEPHEKGVATADDPVGRALFDVLLVLRDPAAAAHNAPYARELLAAAGRVATSGARR